MPETDQELADLLHELLCGHGDGHCARYKPDSAHHDFYEMRAQNLIEGLEPLIGIANVIPVVKIVVGEID